MQSKFITFEGGEGTGKSTQSHLLADYLRDQGITVTITREPGGTEGAELIRALLVSGTTGRWSPLSEVLLLNAARLDHWQKVILPALNAGKWVICDRFTDSTIAYQGYGHGADLTFIKTLNQQLFSSHIPDLTFVFDLDPVIGIKRSLQRHTSENRFENMQLEFHNRMRQGYLEIARENPDRCRIIDATGTVSEIQKLTIKEVAKFIIS
ncbi:dTMP kinase [Candidatus Paracaedibacter symbiosus]|uniref:dTMP kinase n=1 Tax=Candidatus Paracaedibacter symbiosus TaxID=244582 RepID=UPI0005098674|nr:dTMP kinase [Candidatus Paracaedibacter symbiosus]